MRYACVTLLLAGLAVGQAQSPTQGQKRSASPSTRAVQEKPQRQTNAAKPAKVPPSTPVVTIEGTCAKPVAGGACSTIVTRQEFERLLNAVNPPGAAQPEPPPGAKRELAMRYARLLAAANRARQAGLDKSPAAQDLIRFGTLQALAQILTLNVLEKSKPSDAEIQQFYEKNKARMRQAKLQRVMLPADTGTNKQDAPPLSEVAKKLYEQAKAGADFNKLQAEGFQTLGLQNPPDTTFSAAPDALPPQHQNVFDLKPGEVSQLFDQPGAYYFYKMGSIEPLPLDQVNEGIARELQQKKFQAAMESMLKNISPKLNEDYFGSSPIIGFEQMREIPADEAGGQRQQTPAPPGSPVPQQTSPQQGPPIKPQP